MSSTEEENLVEDAEIVAAVLLTLCSSNPKVAQTAEAALVRDTAVEWQLIGTQSTFSELHSALRSTVPRGRMTEIMGRMASAGEQLGLAGTCEQDARRWLDPDGRRPPGWEMAPRALAEITGYYALGAAHGLANVTLRTLLCDRAAAQVINDAFKGARGFEPFAEGRHVWPTLNDRLVSTLRLAADVAQKPEVAGLVESVESLVGNARWRALASRRDVDFHRWRPQSVSGGVAPSDPWSYADGVSTLTGYGRSQHRPTAPVDLVEEAAAGVAALATVMDEWLDRWPVALHECGLPIFMTVEEPIDEPSD